MTQIDALAWIMIVLRAGGVLIIMPVLAGSRMQPTVKMGFAILLATILQPLVPVDDAGLASWGALASAAFGEVLVGIALGWTGRLVFGAVEMAGRVITNEMGMSAAPGFEAPRPDKEPVATALTFLAGLLFFGFNAHHGVLAAFARTFDLAPAGAGGLGPMSPEIMITGTSHLIELGLRMAAPFIALNFLVTLAFAIMSKAVPKMSVFIVSYPIRLLCGLMMLSGFGILLARYLEVEFDNLPMTLLQLVAG